VWHRIQLYGLRRFRAAIAEKRALALHAAAELASIPSLVIDAQPELSLLAFHVNWPKASQAQENDATRELLEEVIARGRVMLTGCTIEGRFLGRLCVLSFRTRREHVDICIRHIREALPGILSRYGA
jgi:aromatic-L-amino-acid decarboxylase